MKHLKRFNESIDMNQYLSDIFLELDMDYIEIEFKTK